MRVRVLSWSLETCGLNWFGALRYLTAPVAQAVRLETIYGAQTVHA
jgi:hypothetical protein